MSEATDATNSEQLPNASALISLAELRKSKQLSLGDIAQKTRLSNKQLDLLESARFSELPGTAFTMGAIRSYCKVLGVPAEPYLEQVRSAYDAAQRGELLQSPDKISKRLPRHSSGGFEGSSSKVWWIASALLALCAIALFVIQPSALTSLVKSPVPVGNANPTVGAAATASAPTTTTTTDPSAPVVGVANPSSPTGASSDVMAGSNSNVPAAGSVAPTSISPGAEGASNSGSSVAASTGSPNNLPATQDIAASLPKTSAQSKIEISTVRDAWVEVRDGTGAVIANRLFRAGSRESVTLTSSTGSVVIGSASGVTLNWNGSPVDLKPHIKDDVARMNLK